MAGDQEYLGELQNVCVCVCVYLLPWLTGKQYGLTGVCVTLYRAPPAAGILTG